MDAEAYLAVLEIPDLETGEVEREYLVSLQLPEVHSTTMGGQGPPGRAGRDAGETFPWHQQISLAVWTVPHNLGRYPSVSVTDDSGNTVYPDVLYVDENIIQITHGRPETGWAYCN